MIRVSDFLVRPGGRPRLKNFDPAYTAGYVGERPAAAKLDADLAELARLQDKLMAREQHALLVVFQSIDGSGKDGTIKQVASRLDPQGCTALNFKQPSEIENRHDYLWRFHQHVPERGRITFFNRSYYEEIVSSRVRPESLGEQNLPPRAAPKDIWRRRAREINDFERYLADNGIVVLKFFLHLSKGKQAERLLERTTDADKKWKFSPADLENRGLWAEYERAHEDMLALTSTRAAPWHVVPADHRWFTALAVADLMVRKLRALKLRYPSMAGAEKQEMEQAKGRLARELKRGGG